MGRRRRQAPHRHASEAGGEAVCVLCAGVAHSHCCDRQRYYFLCACCGLIFADPDSLPTREIEKSFYDLHENDPDDVGYINFLKRLTEPLRQRLTPGMSGLDYGCGPGPAVARLLADAGVSVVNYDPIYANDQGALERCYDVVTCTEVVEHFHQPSIEWAKLFSLVKPGAWLGVMTCVVPDASPQGFRRWWYKGDPTHVSFYQRQTLEWIAARWQVAIDYLDDRVIIMRRLAD